MEIMEIFYSIVGLVAFYAWGHTVFICFKKIKGITSYETVVSIVALITFVLYLIGNLS